MSVRIVPARSAKGGFEYDIWVTWPEGGRIRERGKCTTTGKDASKRWAEARERAIIAAGKTAYRPLHAPPLQDIGTSSKVPTFADFWPRVVRDWYEAQRKKPSTIESVKSIYKNHLAELHGKRLDEIVTAEIAALKGRLAGNEPKTVNNVLSVISRVLGCAVEWEVLPALPCRFGLLKIDDKEMKWYELDDYRRLVDASRYHRSKHLLMLLGGSAGLRRGEIRALKWEQCDMIRKQIRIENALWRDIEGSTKGRKARIVPMTPELYEALKVHRAATGLRERVLYSERGEELSNRTVRNWMEQVQKRAALEVNGGVHILRHTFCSHLAAAGVPAKAIQELAGHKDLTTTMKYMHLSPANRSSAMATLAKYHETTNVAAKAQAG